ncbi:DUF1330 domain-containing protein [Cognatishimia maritima]|uniref:DUF1330 domain-containing protein n=1 Tax=Cognatishimia maritima TaxID=870908 RepID=A0A1M5W016_9RHOB|nr:DUF1330 domain-containing protein [Cognatishimia maritima]SHH80807.1 protein of unknown function [Cognatishimia maritima]
MNFIIKVVAVAAAISVATVTASFATDPQDPTKADWLTFIDIHQVTSKQEALEYAEFVRPIAEKYGVDLMQIYDVVSVEAGDVEGDWVYLFRSPDPQTFGALLNDPEYAANIPNRDRIHDMEWVKRFLLKPVFLSEE